MAKTYKNSTIKSIAESLRNLGSIKLYVRHEYDEKRTWQEYNTPEDETGSIGYGDSMNEASFIDGDCLFHPANMTYSDYSGSLVDRSNCEVFLEKYGETPGVYETFGGYGTRGVAVKLSAITPEMLEEFQAMLDYPLMDDEHHSNLEMQLEDEDWNSWIERDFRRELSSYFSVRDNEDDLLSEFIDDMLEGDLLRLYHERKEATNTYWEPETAVGGHVDIARLVKGTTKHDLPGWV